MNQSKSCCGQDASWIDHGPRLQYWYCKECKNEVTEDDSQLAFDFSSDHEFTTEEIDFWSQGIANQLPNTVAPPSNHIQPRKGWTGPTIAKKFEKIQVNMPDGSFQIHMIDKSHNVPTHRRSAVMAPGTYLTWFADHEIKAIKLSDQPTNLSDLYANGVYLVVSNLDPFFLEGAVASSVKWTAVHDSFTCPDCIHGLSRTVLCPFHSNP